jgi:hypothetical protein
MWHLLAKGGTVGREHEAPPASVAHPDKRHVCISLATTVPLIFTTYSSLHSDISCAATSKQETIWHKYLSLIFRNVTHPTALSVCPQSAPQVHICFLTTYRILGSLCEFLNGILQEGFSDVPRASKGRFTHSMPRPCRSPAMPFVNSHMPCRAHAMLRQCRVLHESPRGSRKYPNC